MHEQHRGHFLQQRLCKQHLLSWRPGQTSCMGEGSNAEQAKTASGDLLPSQLENCCREGTKLQVTEAVRYLHPHCQEPTLLARLARWDGAAPLLTAISRAPTPSHLANHARSMPALFGTGSPRSPVSVISAWRDRAPFPCGICIEIIWSWRGQQGVRRDHFW